jgi:hypothetical protein
MDLKISLKSENGLFNFLKKKIKKKKKNFLGYRHMAPYGAIWRHMMAPHGAKWRHMAPCGARLQPKVFHCIYLFNFLLICYLNSKFK